MPNAKKTAGNHTLAGFLDRFPDIIRAAGAGRLAFAALIALFIGIALWRASGSTDIVVYAIAVLAVFGAFVIWFDGRVQRGLATNPMIDHSNSHNESGEDQGQNNNEVQKLPAVWTLDTLASNIARLPQNQRDIIREVARSGDSGIYVGKLMERLELPRAEIVYRARDLRAGHLLRIESFTDQCVFLDDGIERLLKQTPGAAKALLIGNESAGTGAV